MIDSLLIVGVGLIGGSFALALKAAGVVGEVIGVGRSAANLRDAVALGVIDRASDDLAAVAGSADLILVATPVGQMPTVFETLGRLMRTDAVLTDGGSTKQDVVAAARVGLGARFSRFVPAHPIAGAEHSGVRAASATLYQDKRVVLTPSQASDPAAVARVADAWRACGALVGEMTPAEHDGVFAAVSHLPHLLAFALVHDIAGKENADLLFKYAASGFRDFTRIASSHPEMWRDICVANKQALGRELAAYQARLQALGEALQAGDGEFLYDVFNGARVARNTWLAARAGDRNSSAHHGNQHEQ